MMKVKSALILTGLLGAGSAVAAIGAGRVLGWGGDAAQTSAATMRNTAAISDAGVDRDASLYTEALAATSALRGGPITSAVGRPVSVEFAASLLRAASFGPGPKTPAQWTLFLPTDAAFAPLAGAPLDQLVHHPNAVLAVLDRHLVASTVTLDDLRRGETVSTLGGKPVEVIGGETPRVNGANVLAEHRLGNGRVLIVDALL